MGGSGGRSNGPAFWPHSNRYPFGDDRMTFDVGSDGRGSDRRQSRDRATQPELDGGSMPNP